VLDDFNRGGLCIEVDFSLPAERVVRSLNQIIEWRGQPQVIRVDNGPEYISGTLMRWAEKRNVRLEYIQPHSHTCLACVAVQRDKPQQNAYIERYNRTVRPSHRNCVSTAGQRDEWLGQYIFETIEVAQDQATEWLWLTTTSGPTWASAA